MIDLLLLGTGGMMPLPGRWLSSLLVRCEGDLTLFDCGEGTQVPWQLSGWGFRRLGTIVISHHHADHVAGLPGLLHTLANANRTDTVRLYGPAGTRDVVNGLRVIAPHLPYPLEVIELAPGDTAPIGGGLRMETIATDHALPGLAFRCSLDRARRFDRDTARRLGVPVDLWKRLQAGESVGWEGGAATPDDVLGAPRRGISFAYVTDTRPTGEMPRFIHGVDLLVCEGTYGDHADLPKAIDKRHMTFREAATLARDGEAAQLWMTHFSPAVTQPADWIGQAEAVFSNVTIGYSGLSGTIAFPQDAPADGS